MEQSRCLETLVVYSYNDTSSLWANWVCKHVLKGRGLWGAKLLAKCSWVWRSLLSLCHLMLPRLSCRMGDGSHISFWTDKWLDDGPIITVVGDRLLECMGIKHDILVCDFNLNETWINFINGKEDRAVRKIRPHLQHLLSIIPPQVVFKSSEADTLI